MVTAIILIVLVLLAIFTIKSYMKKLASGCCGAGGDKEEKVKPKDGDIRNYPYQAAIKIGGMHCQKCADRIESAFNKRDGFCAQVDLKQNTAKIYAKQPLSDFAVRSVIVGLGYSAEEITVLQSTTE